MGLPRFHDQPVLLLMYRTIYNLEFVERQKNHNDAFEVTQLINSFLAVIVHPWDQLLDEGELQKVPLESRKIAHGNMEILDRKELRRLRQKGPLPRVTEHEIAGLRLWNQRPGETGSNWSTALDIHELRQVITAMMRLCEKRSPWQDEVRRLQEERDADPKARNAR